MKLSEERIVEYLRSVRSRLQKNDLIGVFENFYEQNKGSLADYLLTRTSMPLFKFMNKIPEHFMAGSEDVHSLVIPGNVKSIGKEAFKDSALEQVKLEDGVEVLGTGCFEGCRELVAIDLADTISIIPNNCFKGCVNLKKVFLPDGIRNIGSDAFLGCDEVEIIANYRDKDKIRGKKSDYEFLKKHLKFNHAPKQDDDSEASA